MPGCGKKELDEKNSYVNDNGYQEVYKKCGETFDEQGTDYCKECKHDTKD